MPKLDNRQIHSFRCHLDPVIGPKPRNAFTIKDFPLSTFEMTPLGVYVKAVYQVPGNRLEVAEHMVPFANVQSIRLMSEEESKLYEQKRAEAQKATRREPEVAGQAS